MIVDFKVIQFISPKEKPEKRKLQTSGGKAGNQKETE
jgi:hypothetical protein